MLWRVPTVTNGRIAGPGDSGGEAGHAVHLFSNKLDAEFDDQPSCVFSRLFPAVQRLRFAVE